MAILNHTPRCIEIKLTKGQVTFVDECDSDLVLFKWSSKTNGHGGHYAARYKTSSDGRRICIYLHRVIFERILNRPLVEGERVDHENGVSIQNWRSNLRLATPGQNSQNMKLHSDSSTGLKGVSFHKDKRKFGAQIMAAGKTYFLGYFNDPQLAHKAYCEAAKELHGKFARFE